jgi:hypothetical protein
MHTYVAHHDVDAIIASNSGSVFHLQKSSSHQMAAQSEKGLRGIPAHSVHYWPACLAVRRSRSRPRGQGNVLHRPGRRRDPPRRLCLGFNSAPPAAISACIPLLLSWLTHVLGVGGGTSTAAGDSFIRASGTFTGTNGSSVGASGSLTGASGTFAGTSGTITGASGCLAGASGKSAGGNAISVGRG